MSGVHMNGDPSMGIIRVEGFDFGFDPMACESCHGYCCRGKPGRIWVNQLDILRISRFLQTNPIDCLEQYMKRIGNRITIEERVWEKEFECVFFHSPTKRCTIYDVRPFQCRRFPFWNIFKEQKDLVTRECPGIRE